jgi:hypothetical protein
LLSGTRDSGNQQIKSTAMSARLSSRHHTYLDISAGIFSCCSASGVSRKHSYVRLMLIYTFLTLRPCANQHGRLSFPALLSTGGVYKRPLACCYIPLSASSITSTFIPSLASPDPVEPHVQGGGLHTWSSVGESVYLPCAKSSIRNTVLYCPGYSLYQTHDSRQATLYGSHRMK